MTLVLDLLDIYTTIIVTIKTMLDRRIDPMNDLNLILTKTNGCRIRNTVILRRIHRGGSSEAIERSSSATDRIAVNAHFSVVDRPEISVLPHSIAESAHRSFPMIQSKTAHSEYTNTRDLRALHIDPLSVSSSVNPIE